MSRPSDVTNKVDDARAYVKWLGGLPYVDKVYLAGSRSPLKGKDHHDGSDWDLIVLANKEKWSVPNPRMLGILHADLVVTTDIGSPEHYKAVEVFPNDPHKVWE